MTASNDWPRVNLHRVVVERHPRWGGRRMVTPAFDRRPYGDWCDLFRMACEAAPDLKYPGAGHVECEPAEVDMVELRLIELTEQTNAHFRDFLERASERQPQEIADIVVMEGALAATGDVRDGWRCGP